jgi:hypothetical protein
MMTTQRLHDADARQHGVAAVLDDQHQRSDGRFPFGRVVLGLGQGCNALASITQGVQLTAVGDRYWIVKDAVPAFVSRSAAQSLRLQFGNVPLDSGHQCSRPVLFARNNSQSLICLSTLRRKASTSFRKLSSVTSTP